MKKIETETGTMKKARDSRFCEHCTDGGQCKLVSAPCTGTIIDGLFACTVKGLGNLATKNPTVARLMSAVKVDNEKRPPKKGD